MAIKRWPEPPLCEWCGNKAQDHGVYFTVEGDEVYPCDGELSERTARAVDGVLHSIRQAGRRLGMNRTTILRLLAGLDKTIGYVIWEEFGEDDSQYSAAADDSDDFAVGPLDPDWGSPKQYRKQTLFRKGVRVRVEDDDAFDV